MKFGLKAVVFGAVATLGCGGAAQASELSFTVSSNRYGLHQDVADVGGESLERHDYRRPEHRYEHRGPHRFYGRPVLAGPGWGPRDTCRIIIKERVNRWAEEVQVRRTVCR
ncbi:hypothetical protein AA309_10195 [Microvirga vignae]|uniref:Uncharacterized protein n=1 Tax=Microvirga vignae TaxID=1225564 RepID=A0A0H1RDJ8_9HYPH|nr:hypothetical protein AA309_10195 [Microvirga vignae]